MRFGKNSECWKVLPEYKFVESTEIVRRLVLRSRYIDGYCRCNETSYTQIRSLTLALLFSVRNRNRHDVLRTYSSLGNALDWLWTGASQGLVQVESLAILRALKQVIFHDIGTTLREPFPNNQRLENEIKLLLNTIDHVL